MMQATFTTAAGVSAVVARPRPDRGACAYQWHVGGSRAGTGAAIPANDAITESKLHFRWPGVPSS